MCIKKGSFSKETSLSGSTAMDVIHGYHPGFTTCMSRPAHHLMILQRWDRTGNFRPTTGNKCNRMVLPGGNSALNKWATTLMHSASIIYWDSFVSGAFLRMPSRASWDVLFPACQYTLSSLVKM